MNLYSYKLYLANLDLTESQYTVAREAEIAIASYMPTMIPFHAYDHMQFSSVTGENMHDSSQYLYYIRCY